MSTWEGFIFEHPCAQVDTTQSYVPYANIIPCPIVSSILMLDDEIMRCGGKSSLNELFTVISVRSSPESVQSVKSESLDNTL